MKRSFFRRLSSTLGFVVALASMLTSAQGASEKQNMLLISVDDLNNWALVRDDYPQLKTPNIDRIRQGGITFLDAHCAAPVCAASRASMMSGRLPHITGFYTNFQGTNIHEAVTTPHLMELFRNNGYKTYGAGKIYHEWLCDNHQPEKYYDDFMPIQDIKWDYYQLKRGDGYRGFKFYPFPKEGTKILREFGSVGGTSLCAGPIAREDMTHGLMPDEMITNFAVKTLQRKEKEPFFLAVGYLRPHVPYTAPTKYFERFPIKDLELPPVTKMQDIPVFGKAMAYGMADGGDQHVVQGLGEDYAKELLQGYLACISFIDDEIGKLLTALDENGHWDNTVIALYSDHGQNFGQKKNWRKMSLWQDSTAMPLVLRVPGNKANGANCSRTVGLIDLYPTLAELCALGDVDYVDGTSLVPLIKNPSFEWEKPTLVAWKYQNFAVIKEGWRYIVYRDGAEELYNRQLDPLEHQNLASNPEFQQVKERLKKALPKNPSLPYKTTEWKGDDLERLIQKWQSDGEPEFYKN